MAQEAPQQPPPPDLLMTTVREDLAPEPQRSASPRTARALAELHAAVVRGEIDTVRRLVGVSGRAGTSRALVNQKDQHGDTALTKCARRGHVNVARLLLDAGADVDAQNAGGYSALMLSCYWDHTEMVNLLLSKGADATMRSNIARECAACSVEAFSDGTADERTMELQARRTGVAADAALSTVVPFQAPGQRVSPLGVGPSTPGRSPKTLDTPQKASARKKCQHSQPRKSSPAARPPSPPAQSMQPQTQPRPQLQPRPQPQTQPEQQPQPQPEQQPQPQPEQQPQPQPEQQQQPQPQPQPELQPELRQTAQQQLLGLQAAARNEPAFSPSLSPGEVRFGRLSQGDYNHIAAVIADRAPAIEPSPPVRRATAGKRHIGSSDRCRQVTSPTSPDVSDESLANPSLPASPTIPESPSPTPVEAKEYAVVATPDFVMRKMVDTNAENRIEAERAKLRLAMWAWSSVHAHKRWQTSREKVGVQHREHRTKRGVIGGWSAWTKAIHIRRSQVFRSNVRRGWSHKRKAFKAWVQGIDGPSQVEPDAVAPLNERHAAELAAVRARADEKLAQAAVREDMLQDMVKKLEAELRQWTHASIAAETDRLWDATLKANGKAPVNMSPAPAMARPPTAIALDANVGTDGDDANRGDGKQSQLDQIVKQLSEEVKQKDEKIGVLHGQLQSLQKDKAELEAEVVSLEQQHAAAREETASALELLAAAQQQGVQQSLRPSAPSQQERLLVPTPPAKARPHSAEDLNQKLFAAGSGRPGASPVQEAVPPTPPGRRFQVQRPQQQPPSQPPRTTQLPASRGYATDSTVAGLGLSVESLTHDEQLIAIRAENVSIGPPGTPVQTFDEELPGAAELRALCPLISPAEIAFPPASPYLTHAEKEIRQLKAKLSEANGQLEELRQQVSQHQEDLLTAAVEETGVGDVDVHDGTEPNAALESRILEIRLECEEQWADHFAEQSIAAENTIEQLRVDLASRTAAVDKVTETLQRLEATTQEQEKLLVAQAGELESRTARVETLTTELRQAQASLKAEREVRAELSAEATGLRQEVASLRAEKQTLAARAVVGNGPVDEREHSSRPHGARDALEERDPNYEYTVGYVRLLPVSQLLHSC